MPSVHAVAPFYSVLIRVNPENPSDHRRISSAISAPSMPTPTDDGKTYTFKIRDRREIPRRLAADRGRRGGKLARDHLPAARACSSARQNWYSVMVDSVEAPDADAPWCSI